jgi:transcriptional regulator with XRE-family HTH domain
MSLGRTIARLRKLKDWKQSDLAERLEVHSSHVTRWEQDRVRPRVSTVEKLAEVFEVSIEELLAEDQQRSRNGIAKLRDPKLLEMLGELHKLPERELDAVKTILDSMFTRLHLEEVLRR